MCKINNKEFWPSKSGFDHDFHVSWLYYDVIRIRDTFVYKHILTAQWGRSAKNWDISTGQFACPFIRSLASLNHSFACSALLALLTRSAALICSLARSLTPELVGKCLIRCVKTNWFCPTVDQPERPAGFRLQKMNDGRRANDVAPCPGLRWKLPWCGIVDVRS